MVTCARVLGQVKSYKQIAASHKEFSGSSRTLLPTASGHCMVKMQAKNQSCCFTRDGPIIHSCSLTHNFPGEMELKQYYKSENI